MRSRSLFSVVQYLEEWFVSYKENSTFLKEFLVQPNWNDKGFITWLSDWIISERIKTVEIAGFCTSTAGGGRTRLYSPIQVNCLSSHNNPLRIHWQPSFLLLVLARRQHWRTSLQTWSLESMFDTSGVRTMHSKGLSNPTETCTVGRESCKQSGSTPNRKRQMLSNENLSKRSCKYSTLSGFT